MPASIGVNLRVTGNCRQGGRKYMEDFFSVAYQQTEDEKDLEYAFFGIYDGHGGAEAAAFAKEHLMETIIKHKNFWSDNDEDVLRAIKDGYIATHYAMWREQSKWPRTSSGLPSTAGTTASVAFIRKGKIYIGHVGDSGIILGYQEPGSSEWKAKPLTKDHKPENPDEMKRIESCGGKVVAKSGVPRVVWNRPKIGHQGPVRRSTPIDEIPFLAVARSLGDLWSYNSQINQFVVSPDPDCSVLPIDTNIHRCLVFGTDGLFNMLSPTMAVHIVQQAERHNECAALSDSVNKIWLNPSKLLVERALDRWHATKMRADNTSVVTLMLDPPGPPRAQVLKDRKKVLPESGLKIMTRYDENTNLESQNSQDSCSKSVQTTDISEKTSPYDTAQVTTVPSPIPENVSKEEDEKETKLKNLEDKTSSEGSTDSNTSISSSDVSSYYPLKEMNFVPKLRESTSFDPREPPRLSDMDKENNTDKVDDNSIQINEISSSNIEDSVVEEDVHIENINGKEAGKDNKCVLRSSTRKNPKNGEQTEKRPAKRKLEPDETPPHQRKSLRLSLTQKFLDNVRKPAPCTLAEEKLKKMAEEAEKIKMAEQQGSETKSKTESQKKDLKTRVADASCKKLSIAQQILRSKKVNLKKKSLLEKRLNKNKLKMVLESVIGKTTKGKVLRKIVEKKKQSGKGADKAQKIPAKLLKVEAQAVKMEEKKKKKIESKTEKAKNGIGKLKKDKKVIVTGKLSNFKRQSVKNSSVKLKDKPVLQGKGTPLSAPKIKGNKSGENAGSSKSSKTSGSRNNKKESLKNGLTTSECVSVGSKRVNRSSSGLKALARNVDVIKNSEAKENVGGSGSKGGRNISKKQALQPQRKNTLSQRIENKTKTLRQTVMKKSS